MRSETEDLKGENLKVDGETVLECSRKVHTSQAFCSSDMPERRSRTKEKIMNFLMENVGRIASSSRNTSLFSKVQQNEREAQSEVKGAVKELEVGFEQTLKEDDAFQGADFRNTEFEVSTMAIQKLNPERDSWTVKQPLPLKSARESEYSCRLEQDRNMLENQAAVKGLELSLKKAEDTICKLHEAKAEISKENVEIKRKNVELLNENSRLIECMTHQAAEYESKLNAAERKIIALQDKLKSIPILQKDMELQTIELIEANVSIEELTSQRTSLLEKNEDLRLKAELVHKLQEDLKSPRVVASFQGEGAAQKPLDKNAGSLKEQLISGGGKCEELPSKVRGHALKGVWYLLIPKDEYESLKKEEDELQLGNMEINMDGSNSEQHESTSVPNDEAAPPSKASAVDDRPNHKVKSVVQKEQGEHDLRIKVSGFYVLVSDAKYFEIDWKEEYKYVRNCGFLCKKCPKKYHYSREIIDHIWCKHYGGRYKCFYCKDSVMYSWRNYIRTHIAKQHPNAEKLLA